ncbi:MAG: sigma factor [Thiohalophilus sp.]
MIDVTAAWENHRKTVAQFLRRRLASEADAEDLTQETFLRLFRGHIVS